MAAETPREDTPHLVLGGARSGKSRFAESLVAEYAGPFIYVATAEIRDDEMRRRVDHHRRRRGDDWSTVECPLDLVSLLGKLRSEGKPVLVDCLTLWMSNLLHRDAATPPESIIQALTDELRRTTCPLVLVSNEVGCGIVPDNALARRFRDLAGLAHQSIAEVCPRVTFVAAGLPLRLK